MVVYFLIKPFISSLSLLCTYPDIFLQLIQMTIKFILQMIKQPILSPTPSLEKLHSSQTLLSFYSNGDELSCGPAAQLVTLAYSLIR
jgi:hypothetical protein